MLFVLYSDSRFYTTRLKWVLDTWAKALPEAALVVIGDAAADGKLKEGACCKYAEAVIIARKVLQQDPSFRWVYFADDDAYVRTDAIESALAQQPEDTSGHGVVFGNFGCAAKGCTGGLCAGGGYAASAQAVERLVDGNASAFLTEQMHFCATCGKWADIALSRIVLERHIDQQLLPGLNGWLLDKRCFDLSLEAEQFEPLMYHYIRSWNQMEFLHRLFLPKNRSTSPGPQPRAGSCASYRGNVQCIESAAVQDRPWVDKATSSCHLRARTEERLAGTPKPGIAGAVWLSAILPRVLPNSSQGRLIVGAASSAP